jgi:glycosyltransferase involved in cell wall biosynthesis
VRFFKNAQFGLFLNCMAQSAIANETHPNPVIDLNVQSRDRSVRELDEFLSAPPVAEASIRTARKFTKLSVLVAVYNEEVTLWPCIKTVLTAPLPDGIDREIILVDDGSTDRSWEVAQRLAKAHPQVRIFQQPANRGKGAAIQRAIKEMTGDLAIFQDADLEYSPSDYRRLLKPILEGKADVVFGSRFIGEERKVLYFWHTVGNKLLTLLANMLNNTNLTDLETCYKVFVADVLRGIPLQSNRFGIEPEVAAKVSRNKLRLYEIPVNYNGRTYEDGKKISWRDGFAALWFIVKYRFSSNYADAGKVALDALEGAPRFNRWMYDTIRKHLGTRIAELGAGRGNLSKFLKQGANVLVTDNRQSYLEELREKWGHLPNVWIARLDLLNASDYEVLTQFKVDTVVCLNVLEHIEDDITVLQRLYRAVPPGCRVVFLVPFNPKLYSRFDREIGHFRRYSRAELEEKMRTAGLNVECQFYFNKAGVIAWWVGNTLFKQRSITSWQLKIYNFLTPLFRAMDYCLPMQGLSTVVVASKAA